MRMLSLLGVAAISMAACATTEDRVGTVDMALTTVGTDGATYRLPVGTFLLLSSGTYIASYDLGADAASLRADIPIGAFSATLMPDLGTTWPLRRERTDGTF